MLKVDGADNSAAFKNGPFVERFCGEAINYGIITIRIELLYRVLDFFGDLFVAFKPFNFVLVAEVGERLLEKLIPSMLEEPVWVSTYYFYAVENRLRFTVELN